jgi:antitoxin CptB
LALERPVNEARSIETRRKRLKFRAWHRGTREMDLIVGRFADSVVPTLDEPALTEFEALIEASDPDLYDWIVGATPPPAVYDTETFRRLRAFHHGTNVK